MERLSQEAFNSVLANMKKAYDKQQRTEPFDEFIEDVTSKLINSMVQYEKDLTSGKAPTSGVKLAETIAVRERAEEFLTKFKARREQDGKQV